MIRHSKSDMILCETGHYVGEFTSNIHNMDYYDSSKVKYYGATHFSGVPKCEKCGGNIIRGVLVDGHPIVEFIDVRKG